MLQLKCDKTEGRRYTECNETTNAGSGCAKDWFEIIGTEVNPNTVSHYIEIKITRLLPESKPNPSASHACSFEHVKAVLEQLLSETSWGNTKAETPTLVAGNISEPPL
jgi:hypothetical protein